MDYPLDVVAPHPRISITRFRSFSAIPLSLVNFAYMTKIEMRDGMFCFVAEEAFCKYDTASPFDELLHIQKLSYQAQVIQGFYYHTSA